MNHCTTVGAMRLFAVLLAAAVFAPAALAEDKLGFPPAPAPPVALEDVPAPPAAPPARDVSVLELGDARGVTPGFSYKVDRAPVRDQIVLEDVTNAAPVNAPGSAPPPILTRNASGCCGTCCPQPCCPDPCCRPRGWDVTAEAGFTWFPEHTGIMGLTPPAGTATFNWGESALDTAIGGRLTIGYRWNARDRLEGRGGYSGKATAAGRQLRRQFGFSATPGAATMLSPPASTDISTESSLWNGEVNWWRQLQCRNSWRFEGIAGVRYLQYREIVQASNWTGLAAGSFLSNTAKNTFIGAQLGGSAAWVRRKFEAGVSVKGLLGHMQNDVRERDTAIVTGGATTDSQRETSNFGYGVEAEASILFRLTRRIGLTAAYTMLWLGNVSRAGETLDFSQAMTGSVQAGTNTESVLIHSVWAGVRVDI